jgi:hypothetical protein
VTFRGAVTEQLAELSLCSDSSRGIVEAEIAEPRRRGEDEERAHAAAQEAELGRHVERASAAIGQLPAEAVHERGEREVNEEQAEVDPGARPLPRAEGQQLEVMAPDVEAR